MQLSILFWITHTVDINYLLPIHYLSITYSLPRAARARRDRQTSRPAVRPGHPGARSRSRRGREAPAVLGPTGGVRPPRAAAHRVELI